MYDLDEKKLIEFIKQNNGKRVLLQLPDGLKPKAAELVKLIEKEVGCEVIIWFGTCFGACDLPQNVTQLGIDLVVGFGHNTYIKEVKKW